MDKIIKSLGNQSLPALSRLLIVARKMNNKKLEQLIAQAIVNEQAQQAAADILERAAFN